MKFIYINPNKYTFRGKDLKYGDIFNSDEDLTKRYKAWFVRADYIKPKKEKKNKFHIRNELTLKQLKELAKKYNIKLENGLAKKEIINKIKFALPNE